MSDVHSVGGYLTAGSLFALGIAGWQVLVALLDRHRDREGLLQPGREAQPGDRGALPGDQPGDLRGQGGEHPGDHPGLIAIAWYGVQTYLAAESLNIIFLKFVPASRRR